MSDQKKRLGLFRRNKRNQNHPCTVDIDPKYKKGWFAWLTSGKIFIKNTRKAQIMEGFGSYLIQVNGEHLLIKRYFL